MAGCARDAVVVRDGKKYGVTKGTFRARWWNYYERGRSYQDGALWQKAAADFEKALKARSTDEWRARTYGLHFTSYFPNRELGVCYHHLERHEEAAGRLEVSLGQVETARAHKYLDLVREVQLARGVLADTALPVIEVLPAEPTVRRLLSGRTPAASAPAAARVARAQARRGPLGLIGLRPGALLSAILPSLILASPPQRLAEASRAIPGVFVTASQSFPVVIRSKDDMVVASVSVQDKDVYLRNSGKEIENVEHVPLEEGINTIEVQARDLAGNSVETGIQVRLDLNAPVISIQDPPPALLTEAESVDIEGSVRDDVGLEEVAFDGESLLSVADLDPGAAPPREVELEYYERPLTPDAINLIRVEAHDLAGNDNQYDIDVYQGAAKPEDATSRLPGTRRYPQAAMPGTFLVFASALSGVDVRFALAQGTEVFVPELMVRGEVAAVENVTALKVNGTPLAVNPAPTLQWARRVALEPGRNTIEVEAVTSSGGKARATLTLERSLGFLETAASRLRAAFVLGSGPEGGEDLGAEFEGILIEDGRFDLARPQAVADELSALGAAQGNATRKDALRAARRTGARILLFGVFERIGSDYELIVHVVEAASRDVLGIADGQAAGGSDADAVRYELGGLVQQLRAMFPLVRSKVVSPGTMDGGSKDGWREGAYLMMGTAPTVMVDFRPAALARITRVAPHTSTYHVLEQFDEMEPREGLLAVAM